MYSNDELVLTLTFFTARSNLLPYALDGKIYNSSGKMLESHLMEETYNP